MLSQPVSVSTPSRAHVYSASANSKDAGTGGSLKRGLDRLTRVLERRIDHQIMTAQIRANDNFEAVSDKARYT
jgi:hypothetical protein